MHCNRAPTAATSRGRPSGRWRQRSVAWLTLVFAVGMACAAGSSDVAVNRGIEGADAADTAASTDRVVTRANELRPPTGVKWQLRGPSGIPHFGLTLAASADILEDNALSDTLVVSSGHTGGVHLFEFDASNPTPSAVWSARPDPNSIGWQAAVGNLHYNGYDDVIAAAPHFAGVHLFYTQVTGPPTTWDWRTVDEQPGERTGRALAIGKLSGGRGNLYASDLAVGAYLYDAPGQPDAGRVHVHYYQPPSQTHPDGILSQTPGWTMVGDAADAHMGNALAVGDFDGDDRDDLAVASDMFEGPGLAGGRVYVFLGTPEGLPPGDPMSASAWQHSPFRAWARFGRSLATGQVNDDRRDELLVGSYWYSDEREYAGPNASTGAAFLFLGAGSGQVLSTSPDWKASLSQLYEGAELGFKGHIIADQTGDATPDLAVTAPGWKKDRGAVFVYSGAEMTTEACPYWYAEGKQTGDRLGTSLTSLTYAENDETTEHLAVGAPSAGETGEVYVFDHLLGKSNRCDDADGDGYVFNPTGVRTCCSAEPDCEDHDAAINPGVAETCNGRDDNCDGVVDNGGLQMCSGTDTCVGGRCAPKCETGECPTGYVCDDDICKPEPTTGPNCTPPDIPCNCPDSMSCDRGVCELTCTLDRDCGLGGTCDGGTCEQLCVDDSICDGGESCVERTCRTKCSADTDCRSQAAQMCGVDDTVCVEGVCRFPCSPGLDECDRDEVCEVVDGTGVCRARPCDSSAQCGPRQTCVDDSCVTDPDACVSDSDCVQPQVCVSGQCDTSSGGHVDVGDPCGHNNDCASGLCDNGTCAPGPDAGQPNTCDAGASCDCVESDQCDLDQVCDQGTCATESCAVDADCAPGFHCLSAVCHRRCSNDNECGPGGVCRDEVCRHSCADGHRCPPNKRCVAGVCHAGPPHTVVYGAGGCGCGVIQTPIRWNHTGAALAGCLLLALVGLRSRARRQAA